MATSMEGLTSRQFVGLSLALVVLTIGAVLTPMVISAHRLTARNTTAEVFFGTLFFVALLIPLAAVRHTQRRRAVAKVQGRAGVAACVSLLLFRPESSGMYLLPLLIIALATLITSLAWTIHTVRAEARC